MVVSRAVTRISLGLGLLSCLLVLLGAPGHAAILYIDKDQTCPGVGTNANPYCSLANAFSAVAAGDTIRIRDAATPYDESVTTTTTGTLANPITVEPDLGHNPVLRYTGNSATAAVIHLSDVNYWTIQNLTFDGTGVWTSRFALWLGAGTTADGVGNQLLGNTFKNWGGTEAQANDATAPVETVIISGGYPGGPFMPNGTVIRGNIFDGNRHKSLVLLSTKNSLVEYNEFKNAKCGRNFDTYVNELGIHLISGASFATGDVIRHNTFHDWAPHSDCGLTAQLDATWAPIWCDVGPSSGIIEGNTIWNIDQHKPNASNPLGNSHGSYGIFIELDCTDWTVQKNIVYDVGYAGLRNSNGTAGAVNKWFNNTVYSIGVYGMQFFYGNGVAKNNLIVNSGTAAIVVRTEAITQGGITIDYNLYWDEAGGTKVGQWAGGTLDFSSWKNACNCDSHSKNADPLLGNPPTDMGLKRRSPAVDAGVDVGLPYRGRAPDLGARESDYKKTMSHW